jgi:hypothetical protein
MMLYLFTFFIRLKKNALTVALGNTLNLILLLDSIRVGRSTSSIDQLLCQTLRHGLEVSETSLTSTSGNQVQSIVYPTERRHVHGLTSYNSSTSNTGGIFTRSRVDDGIDYNLDRVLVGKKVDDFKSVLNDASGHDFLSRVTTLSHEATGKTLNDGARGLTETFHLVTASSVWEVCGMISLAGNVILF